MASSGVTPCSRQGRGAARRPTRRTTWSGSVTRTHAASTSSSRLRRRNAHRAASSAHCCATSGGGDDADDGDAYGVNEELIDAILERTRGLDDDEADGSEASRKEYRDILAMFAADEDDDEVDGEEEEGDGRSVGAPEGVEQLLTEEEDWTVEGSNLNPRTALGKAVSDACDELEHLAQLERETQKEVFDRLESFGFKVQVVEEEDNDDNAGAGSGKK
mmetsp:Transcript_15904/g.40566  ORF Transcript_15904/g.40566 Transcript_15904/m.40566 type:complete len:218 (+) Transcript_15904:70-723(+)